MMQVMVNSVKRPQRWRKPARYTKAMELKMEPELYEDIFAEAAHQGFPAVELVREVMRTYCADRKKEREGGEGT